MLEGEGEERSDLPCLRQRISIAEVTERHEGLVPLSSAGQLGLLQLPAAHRQTLNLRLRMEGMDRALARGKEERNRDTP